MALATLPPSFASALFLGEREDLAVVDAPTLARASELQESENRRQTVARVAWKLEIDDSPRDWEDEAQYPITKEAKTGRYRHEADEPETYRDRLSNLRLWIATNTDPLKYPIDLRLKAHKEGRKCGGLGTTTAQIRELWEGARPTLVNPFGGSFGHDDCGLDGEDPREAINGPRFKAAKYTSDDIQRFTRWQEGDWYFVGVVVTAYNADGAELCNSSVWGIEVDSDEEYLLDTVHDMLRDLEVQAERMGFYDPDSLLSQDAKDIDREGNL